MTNFDLLADVWLQLLIIMLVTVAIMMAFVGIVVQKMMGESLVDREETSEVADHD